MKVALVLFTTSCNGNDLVSVGGEVFSNKNGAEKYVLDLLEREKLIVSTREENDKGIHLIAKKNENDNGGAFITIQEKEVKDFQ